MGKFVCRKNEDGSWQVVFKAYDLRQMSVAQLFGDDARSRAGDLAQKLNDTLERGA